MVRYALEVAKNSDSCEDEVHESLQTFMDLIPLAALRKHTP